MALIFNASFVLSVYCSAFSSSALLLPAFFKTASTAFGYWACNTKGNNRKIIFLVCWNIFPIKELTIRMLLRFNFEWLRYEMTIDAGNFLLSCSVKFYFI